ncbi:hypothetical protein M3G00_07920 [Brevibacterium casei]|uniref:hypothetical protein n=1 Tax=Brevibacterium casei TaxID=33889 RepID=UPI00223BAB38|nr:hypothetical protein [Brevibacterium casei]MCT2182862.1 hypothetical protein [Brevibacterium casei]
MSRFSDNVLAERASQPEKGYTSEHDDEHGPSHCLDLAEQYLRVARWGAASKGKHDIRDLLVKATAMLLAAGDTWDRSVEEANDEQ